MFLLVKPGVKGWSKWWRFKYLFGVNKKGLSCGTCPEVSLDDARKLTADGIDPSKNKKAVKKSKADIDRIRFEVIAREWHEVKSDDKSRRLSGYQIT